MRCGKAASVALGLVLGLAVGVPAQAHDHDRDRGRVHFGLYFGAPLGWPDDYDGPRYYYPPYPAYYPPRVVVVPAEPPVYIQRSPAEPASSAQPYYWYYCRDSGAYYPYVKQCPGGWQRVAPQPPPAQ